MADPTLTITKALPGFLDYMKVERHFSGSAHEGPGARRRTDGDEVR
jgi:hypothetical protein